LLFTKFKFRLISQLTPPPPPSIINSNKEHHKPKQCKICNTPNSVIFDYQTLESVCNVCGAVLPEDDDESLSNIKDTIGDLTRGGKERVIKDASGSREFDMRQNSAYMLSTVVYAKNIMRNENRHNNDDFNNHVTPQQWQEAHRLEKSNNRVLQHCTSSERRRSLITADKILYKLKSELNLSGVLIERTLYYVKMARDRKLIKGRSTDQIVLIGLHLSFKELNNITRPFEELAEPLGLTTKQIKQTKRIYRTIIEILGINPSKLYEKGEVDTNPKYLNKYITRMSTLYPEDKYGNDPVTPKLYTRAADIVKTIVTKNPTAMEGHRPSLVELVALIMAYDEEWERTHNCEVGKRRGYDSSRTKHREFAEMAGVSMVSIRNTSSFINETLAKLEEKEY